MSQHNFSTTYLGKSVNVLLGWDRPLQYVFMVIIESLTTDNDDEKIIYSNLYDRASDGAHIGYYEQKLKELGIVVPQRMFREVHQDYGFNVGNHYCDYLADGTFTDSLRLPSADAKKYLPGKLP
jgi:hypothetical protein